MATTLFAGNPQVWASYNLTLNNKQFDVQMKQFLLQLSQWATLIQTYVTPGSYYIPAGPAGPPGPTGPTGPTGPAGSTGAAGNPAYTTLSASLTIPPVGNTTTVNVANTSWIAVGEMVYVAGAGGTGQTGALQVTAIAGNTVTLLNPVPAPAIPPADNTQAGLLNLVSGVATDFVGGDNASHAHSTVPLDTLGPTTDILTRNASTSAHGLLPKLSGTATTYLNGSGAFASIPYTQITGTPTLGTSAAKDVPASGNASTVQVVYGNDTRLSDARTPSSTLVHAATHKSGGSDLIALDTLGVTTDITALNASTSAHGLLAKLSGLSTDFVGGDNACHALAAAVASALFTTWTAFTLTASAGAGTITTQTSNSAYLQIGKLVFVHFQVTISNIGTASGTTNLNGFPVAPVRTATFATREVSVNGLTCIATLGTGATAALFNTYSNGNPAWTNGISYVGQGIYQSG
jgi:hypothetical protein